MSKQIMHTTVKQILQRKGQDIWFVKSEATVFEALQLMAEKSVGALLVFEDGKIVGLFSERDYARRVILEGRSSKNTPVGDIMTEKVFVVHPNNTTMECMVLMTEKRVRHLPVLDDDQLVGVISIGDVVKAIISEQEFVIEQLENYITGNHTK